MEWVQDFESGLPEIDVQHQHIFTLIERIRDVEKRSGRSGVRDAVIELERVTRAHFEFEERLMVAYDYRDSAKHAADHESLLREVQSYQDNTIFNARQLTLVLFNWLVSHTMMEDRPLALHILRLRAGAGDASMNSEPVSAVQVKIQSKKKHAVRQ